MAITIPRKLQNFTAFVDGRGYAGLVTEVEPPKITIKTEEYRAAGMDTPIEIDMGTEKLEATLTFAEHNKELFKALGLLPGGNLSITLRGAGGEGSATNAITIELRGRFKELDQGSWKSGDEATVKFMVALRYYKLTIDGEDVVEIDTENMKRMIGGVDQLAGQRDALNL